VLRVFDLLITGGTVVDAESGKFAPLDVAVSGGAVADVAEDLRGRGARRVIDAAGCWVLPGLVDTHVHVCGPFAGIEGYRMMARAGVTTALDLAGNAADLAAGLRRAGAGQTMAFVFPLVPGESVRSAAPDDAEIAGVRDAALASGALGVKVLGGHYPLTPEATAAVIRLAHDARCWCAVHAGTTATPGDIDGMEELIALAEGRPLHVPHINSYCRGARSREPIGDAARAIRALAATPSAVSESYLARINGASAAIADGVPKSHVV
jgi:cytosine/adenosine deaminase-related metal-dependent hydrolase